ncbi:MAG TPA: ATP-binding protein [Thermoanaerobaculia bacterium]|nr:ATP-binding protein [Thermoanaerobaculia bacterium]
MPSAIVIPNRLNELLGQSSLAHAVRQSVQDFESWIGDPTKGLFFFPEYSDHGPKHISAVLAGVEALIREEAWEHLTPEDAVVLVLATLLHDSAMHLMADGFLELIDPKRGGERLLIRPLDEKTWPELFEQFYLEARRWDQRTLHNILGDQEKKVEEEEDLVVHIRHPKEMPDPEDWSVRYRKFLGEFVRRHHARLAHEIARSGVPGHRPLTLARVPAAIADLAGLVARSHNMSLRDTFLYLKEMHYGRVSCSNSRPVFLMALLRIADYLEIRADRVHPTLQGLQRLRSPISQEEWNAHLAVHEVRPDDEDKEALFVVAKPPTARTFLKLQRLLQGLQAELDTSWAVLGEVFSLRFPQFGMTLRRVRSNLDDSTQFVKAEKPSYVPARAAFGAAGADLLKLLIKPLYGDRPEIGIRELLQNALDAVHELRQYAADKGDPQMESIPLPDQEKDIIISIDHDSQGQAWLTVSDKGIGMTAEVVKNYFLTAGASFRASEIWRHIFETQGRSRVLRSGRFGVGALAAFLLGNRVIVSTRHVEASPDDGLFFEASVEDDLIELRIQPRERVGTTIRIHMHPSAAQTLIHTGSLYNWHYGRHCWDWYVLDDPEVERRVDGEILGQHYHISAPGKQAPGSDWHAFYPEGYRAVLWSYSRTQDLTCNGISIPGASRSTMRDSIFEDLNFPAVAVFDPDGRLPLTLVRDNLATGKLPFSEDLFRDIMADFCAFLLSYPSSFSDWHVGEFFSFRPGFLERAAPCVNPLGVFLSYPLHIKKTNAERVLLLLPEVSGDPLPIEPAPAADILAWGTLGKPKMYDYLNNFYSILGNGYAGESLLYKHSASPRTKEEEQQPFLKRFEEHNVYDLANNWTLYISSESHPSNTLKLLPEQLPASIGAAVELFFDPAKVKVPESPLTRFLDDFLDVPFMPIGPKIGREILPRAYSKLQSHLEAWQSPNLTGWRQDLARTRQASFLEREPTRPASARSSPAPKGSSDRRGKR